MIKAICKCGQKIGDEVQKGVEIRCFEYKLCQEPLVEVDYFCYLGVDLAADGTVWAVVSHREEEGG